MPAWTGRATDPNTVTLRASYGQRVKALRLVAGAMSLPCVLGLLGWVAVESGLWHPLPDDPILLTPPQAFWLWVGIAAFLVLPNLVAAAIGRCPRCRERTPLLTGAYASCPTCRFVFREDRVRASGQHPTPGEVFRATCARRTWWYVAPLTFVTSAVSGTIVALLGCYLGWAYLGPRALYIQVGAGLWVGAALPVLHWQMTCPACSGTALTIAPCFCGHCATSLFGDIPPTRSVRLAAALRPVVATAVVLLMIVQFWGQVQPAVQYRMLALATGHGTTGLAFSMAISDMPTTTHLLERGADPNDRGVIGTVLADAVWREAVDGDGMPFVRLLLDAGADPGGGDLGEPLEIAISEGHLPLVRFLWSAGARPGDMTSRDLLLRIASGQGNPEIIRLLLDDGAHPDGRGCVGPLASAAYHGNTAAIRMLLDRGAHVDGGNACEKTPRDIALEKGHAEAASALLAAGARMHP